MMTRNASPAASPCQRPRRFGRWNVLRVDELLALARQQGGGADVIPAAAEISITRVAGAGTAALAPEPEWVGVRLPHVLVAGVDAAIAGAIGGEVGHRAEAGFPQIVVLRTDRALAAVIAGQRDPERQFAAGGQLGEVPGGAAGNGEPAGARSPIEEIDRPAALAVGVAKSAGPFPSAPARSPGGPGWWPRPCTVVVGSRGSFPCMDQAAAAGGIPR
jgi:hypothetical protein